MNDIGLYRQDGPDTMKDAAVAIADQLPTMRERVFVIISERGPILDVDIHQEYIRRHGYALDRSIMARRRELVMDGLVEDSGERKPNPFSGRLNILWIKKGITVA